MPKYPAYWSTLPADESLVRAWEAAMAQRLPANEELTKRYQSLYGALLHTCKFRPEINAAMGLLGSCLTCATEELYECMMHVLVYLGRSRNLGTTFSAHGEDASKVKVYCDANWGTTRSTTGYCIMLAGGSVVCVSRRQHCISMSSCESELYALADSAIELLHVLPRRAQLPRPRDARRHRGEHGQQGRVRPVPPLHFGAELAAHRPEALQDARAARSWQGQRQAHAGPAQPGGYLHEDPAAKLLIVSGWVW